MPGPRRHRRHTSITPPSPAGLFCERIPDGSSLYLSLRPSGVCIGRQIPALTTRETCLWIDIEDGVRHVDSKQREAGMTQRRPTDRGQDVFGYGSDTQNDSMLRNPRSRTQRRQLVGCSDCEGEFVSASIEAGSNTDHCRLRCSKCGDETTVELG